MKKQFSLVLTIILILSLTPIALADNTDTISAWNIRISVPEGKTAVMKGSEYDIYGQLGPDTESVLVDSDFMLVTGLSEMRKALNDGATVESVYYTDGYGFSVSEFTTTDPDEMKALWDVLTKIRLGAPTNMSITDWYPLIVFNLDDGTRYGARFEGHCLSIRRDKYELENADEFWTLTGTLVQKYTQGAKRNFLVDYAPVLNSYFSFLSGKEPTEMSTTERGDYYFVLGETGISEMSRNGGQLGFWLHDMDGNGIPELLIGATGAEFYDESLIYDMFTLEEGTPVRIFASSARIRYYLCEDDLILYEGSGGAPYNLSILYYLKNNRLELATGIVMADSECFEVHEDRESFFTDRRQSDRRISREEYYDKMEKLEAATVHMDLMPF